LSVAFIDKAVCTEFLVLTVFNDGVYMIIKSIFN